MSAEQLTTGVDFVPIPTRDFEACFADPNGDALMLHHRDATRTSET